MVEVIKLAQKRRIVSLQALTGPKGWNYVKLSALAEATGYSTEQLIQQFFVLTKHGDKLPMLARGQSWEDHRFIWASKEAILRWIQTNRPYEGTSLEVVSGWADDVLQEIIKRQNRILVLQTAQEIVRVLRKDAVMVLEWREDSPRDLDTVTRVFKEVQRIIPKAICKTAYHMRQNDDDPAITWRWSFYLPNKVQIAFIPFGEGHSERLGKYPSAWKVLAIDNPNEGGGVILHKYL